MMAINFPAAAFLAGLKGPNQIMYCISQDSVGGTRIIAQDNQQAVPGWNNHEASFKEIQQNNGGTNTGGSQPQSIRVEPGSQVS